jgi:hypothetical protein
MTVSFFAGSVKNGGFAPDHVFLTYPAPTQAGMLALAGRVTWENMTVKIADGWIDTADRQGGTGTGDDAHTTRIHVDRRQLRGTELGLLTLLADAPASPTVQGHYGVVVNYQKDGDRWDVVATSGDDAAHGTNRSATGSAIALRPGDVVVAFAAVDTDTDLAGFASPAITAPGITFGATTRRTSGAGTPQGSDGNIEVFDATVTAGTATAAPTLTFTTTTNQCGPVAFVRLREIAAIVSGWRPSTQALLDLVDVPRRFDDFRFDVVDHRNRKIGEVHPDLERKPAVTWDTKRAVHRSLDSFYLPSDEQNDIDVITDRIRPFMVLQNGAEYSLGVFLWTDSQQPRRPWGLEREGTLLDRTYVLDQEGPWPQSIPKDRSVLQWVIEFLHWFPEFEDIFAIEPGHGDNLGAKVIQWVVATMSPEDASRTLNAPVTWPIASHTLKMFNDIMALLTYKPVHCDRDGTLQFRYATPLELIEPSLDYSLTNGRMIEQSIVQSTDKLNVPNRVFVYETSINSSMIWGEWWVPSPAPYSVNRRRYLITKSIAMTGLRNADEATAAARRYSEWLIKAGDWIEWSGPADPRHDVYDVLRVLGEKWLEVSWKLPCVAGEPMTHKALRVYTSQEPT